MKKEEKVQEVETFIRLGKQIKISPKTNASVNKKGFSVKFNIETVSVRIAIGTHHHAELVMERDAWDALNNGAKVDTETTVEFENKHKK